MRRLIPLLLGALLGNALFYVVEPLLPEGRWSDAADFLEAVQPAEASNLIKRVTIAPSSDRKHHSKYPNGNAPPASGPLAWSGLAAAVENAGSLTIVVGTQFSYNVCPNLVGDEASTATLSVVHVSGDNAIAEGWSLSAPTCASGTSNLVHSALQTGSGVARLFADGINSDDQSGVFNWAASGSDPGDSGYQFPSGTTPTASSAALTTYATFHNAGVEWSEVSGSSSNEALCRFRQLGTASWTQCHSLWWDYRTAGTGVDQVPFGFLQYRGSIFKLSPNTTYEIEVLTASTRKLATAQVTTWNETFTIASTVTPALSSTSTLTISSGGSAGTGYVRYFRSGGFTIDGNELINDCIVIDAPYVIIDGGIIRECKERGIRLTGLAHHIVIEDSTFSLMGYPDPNATQFACGDTANIGTRSGSNSTENLGITNVVIQNNQFLAPAYDSSNWEEVRPNITPCGAAKGPHAVGAMVLHMKDIGGHSVFRYNTASADYTHMYEDGTGGGQNFSYAGDCPVNCDKYRNSMSHFWDDVLTSEGAGRNNRTYENDVSRGLVCYSGAPVSIGPTYIFRNICRRGNRSADGDGKGNFFKVRSKPSGALVSAVTIGHGGLFLYHNSMVRTSDADGVNQPLSVDEGSLANIKSRCNILTSNSQISGALVPMVESDLNRDLFRSIHTVWAEEESNAIFTDAQTYEVGHASGPYTPAAGTPAIDGCAEVIPNVNDNFLGAAPELGAIERGQTAVIYGNQ